MPVLHSVIHKIDKKPDGNPAILHHSASELVESQTRDELINQLNESYNAKPGKGWGFFHAESGAHPFSGWLSNYLAGTEDFMAFTNVAVEHLQKLMEESNLTVGGNALFCHYRQGMTDYLVIALVQEAEAVIMTDGLTLQPIRRLDLDSIFLAARINLSEWKNNPASKQYVSFLKAKKGRRVTEYFRDFIGVQEGIDGPGETRTLLKAFSDFVAAEDLAEDDARYASTTLVDYAAAQTKLGEAVNLEELSELITEARPTAFLDHIRSKDYGLSPEIPADKRTLNHFRRFTGRTEGLSISFESHLLGSKVEYNEASGTLTLRNLPTQLTDQLKRVAS